MTATGKPGDDHQDVGPEAGQPEDAPPPPQWLNDGEAPGGAAPLLPEPASLPPFGTPLPEEPEEDTNRTVSDLDLSGMRTQIFKKDDESATGDEPPPLPPFPGTETPDAVGAPGGEDARYTVADPAKWKDSGGNDGDATMIVDTDKTMQVNGQPPAPPAPPGPPEAQPFQPEAPSDATRIEQAIEPETQQIAGAQQPAPPPAPEPFPWAQEVPGPPPAPVRPDQPPQPPQPPPAAPAAPQPFPWAQEIPGPPPAPPNQPPSPSPEPFPYAQEIPGTPTAPAQPDRPASPQPFPWAQEIPGANSPSPSPAQPVSPPPPIDEPWRTTPQQNTSGGRKKGKKKLLMGVAGLAAAALIAGGGFTIVSFLGEDDADGAGSAQLASSTFAVSGSGATDGRDQRLESVFAVGSTVVAVGVETGPDVNRDLFLVSTDNGRTFKSAAVQGNGDDAPAPQAVAGSQNGWIAIGSGDTGGAVWASPDGLTWTRQPAAAGKLFGQGNRVERITATNNGFIAVGQSKGQAAIWLSADGRQWEAVVGEQIGLKIEKASFSLVEIATNGDAVLLQALVKPDKEKSPPVRMVWSSGDGGRTWTPSKVPAPKGTNGLQVGGGQAGFVAIRKIQKKGGDYGQAFVSADGQEWSKAGTLEVEEFTGTVQILGGAEDFTTLVNQGGDVLLMHSADGSSWKPAGTASAEPGRKVLGAASAGGQTILVGNEPGSGDTDPLLAVWDSAGQQVPVDPSKIPGAIRRDHAVHAVGASGSQAIAVGSANGDVAVWSSTDGASWKAAQGLGAAFTRPGSQRLVDVVTGDAGWLAVGYSQSGPKHPLAVTSQDGTTWNAADSGEQFQAGKGNLVTNAAAAGSASYVIVGTENQSAAVWYSADLKSWERGAGADLQGQKNANRWMLDVAAADSGFVAAGGHRDAQGNHPAVWSSADGRQWTLKSLPVPNGVTQAYLTHVAAKGDVLVAAGVATTPQGAAWIGYVSADGGRTWRDLPAPGGDKNIQVTALTATPDGFVGAGTGKADGTTDVVSMTSPDGSTWKAEKPGGTGLGGDGDQQITGLASFGDQVVGVGRSAAPDDDQPVLWRR